MEGPIRILLICDNEEMSVYLTDELVRSGQGSVFLQASGAGGIAVLKESNFDVVIAKLGVFDFEALELVKALKKASPSVTIIGLLEEKSDPAQEKDLMRWGVYDFIRKPIDPDKLFFFAEKGAQLHAALSANHKLVDGLKECNVALEKQNNLLTKRIEESTKNLTRLYENLRTTYLRTIKVLAQAIDARDHYTHSHSENVARFAVAIAEEMKLSARDVETLREACELHDLGKIGVEDSILSKTSSLNDFEWEQIKRHPSIGAKILEPLTFLNDVIELVRQHHEHYDGLGYPEGRAGEDIILGARIIHLADAYESMRSARSYRKTPLTKEEAVEEIRRNRGTQFDPRVVDAFLLIVDNLV